MRSSGDFHAEVRDYGQRTYRGLIGAHDLCKAWVRVRETDLFIMTSVPIGQLAHEAAVEARSQVEGYIERDPGFLTSFVPREAPPEAPLIVKCMAKAAKRAGVGPMAAVAGAIAEWVGRKLLERSPEVIVENGGDIFLASHRRRIIGVFAGDSPFTGRIGMEFEGDDVPMGVCTSAGTVGHSTSLGRADAAIVIARDVAFADACATVLGNLVQSEEDVQRAAEYARNIEGIEGALVIKGKSLAAFGNVKIVRTELPAFPARP